MWVIFDNTDTGTSTDIQVCFVYHKMINEAKRFVEGANSIFWSKYIEKRRKNNIYNTMVKSGLLFGAETWRIIEKIKRKLNKSIWMNKSISGNIAIGKKY